MKLKTRLLVLYIFLLATLFTAFFLQRAFSSRGSVAIRQKETTQDKLLLDRVIDLKGHALETVSVDYTFWDDMVNFVQTGDQTFANENLVTALKTYDADAIWVYKPTGNLVYATNDIAGATNPGLGINFSDQLLQQLNTAHFMHFFIQTDNGLLLEVRAATIHPSSDEAHQTIPRGYFFVAKAWDTTYLSSLSDLTQLHVSLGLPGQQPVAQAGQVAFTEPLNDWSQTPLKSLNAMATSTISQKYNGSASAQIIVLVGFGFISLAVLVWFLTRAVEEPLAMIAKSIADGKPGTVSSLARASDEFGQLARLLKAFYEQKVDIARAEARNKELVKLAHVKDEFVSIASHQLRTPASAVKGYLSLILDQPPGKQSVHKTREYVETAYRENEQQLLIINDLLNVTQMDTGSFRLNKTLTDIGELVTEVIDEQQILVSTKFQKLSYKKPKRATHVLIDREKIRMVLNNLLNNASNFTPEHGKINVGLITEDDTVTISISDSGHGIDKSSMRHLFQRFSRADDPQVVQTGGAGLGLYMVKKILELHGGTVHVDSRPGHGSTFKITIPFELQ